MSHPYPSPRAANQTYFAEEGKERGCLAQARREVQGYKEAVRQTTSCPYLKGCTTGVKLSTVLTLTIHTCEDQLWAWRRDGTPCMLSSSPQNKHIREGLYHPWYRWEDWELREDTSLPKVIWIIRNRLQDLCGLRICAESLSQKWGKCPGKDPASPGLAHS